ncbi:MAG: hypothetical protein R2861_01590 [Desulfobacterales bacterium]
MEVAERRRVEQELRKSQEFHGKSVCLPPPGLMLILDPEGRIIDLIRIWKRFPDIGRRSERLLLERVFSPEDPKKKHSPYNRNR